MSARTEAVYIPPGSTPEATQRLQDAVKQSFKKPGRRIKISKNLRPFVSRVVREGKVQKAFTEKIGRNVGRCVRNTILPGTHGYSGKQVHGVAKICAQPFKGAKLFGPGALPGATGTAVAGEYFEVD
jgi:hypothetical protein